MTGKQMIRKYKENGWRIARISKGSHHQMEKKGHQVAIPYHVKELKKGLQHYLLKLLEEVG